ncbi:hypothetical protein [Bacillus sp. 2205SS5-2]
MKKILLALTIVFVSFAGGSILDQSNNQDYAAYADKGVQTQEDIGLPNQH